MNDLNAEQAQQQFKEVVNAIKAKTIELMKTRQGRDEIRQVWGCRIEGFEDEELDGIPPGMFNSPMQ